MVQRNNSTAAQATAQHEAQAISTAAQAHFAGGIQRVRQAASLVRTVWRNRQRQTDVPRLLTYIVTFTCNARCIMCDSWKKPGKDDLSLDEIETVFRQLPTLDIVRLTGGEPFVRRDLPDIVALAQRHLKPVVLHITSNGFNPERIVPFCEQRPKDVPLHLLISVDGFGDKHNQVRGHDGAWKRVDETLRALAPRRRELRLRLGVNQTVVDREGLEHYRRLRDYLKPLGIRNQLIMAYDVSATYSLTRELDVAPKTIGQFATFGDFGEADIRALLDEFEADLKDFPLPEQLAKRYYLQGIRERLLAPTDGPTGATAETPRRNSDKRAVNPPCVALSSHLRLLPNGDVPTCQFNSKTVGNLRHQSFQTVWSAVRTEEQRRWVRRCPGCWAECEVLPNAIYSGDLLRHPLRSLS